MDPIALAAMLPFFSEQFANPGSITHESGRAVGQVVDEAMSSLAHYLGAEADEIVLTSGATESNNLALFGVVNHPRQKRRKIVSLATEHHAILDPLHRLAKTGFEVVYIPVRQRHEKIPGEVILKSLAEAIDDQTALVTIMMANNEIGTLQPMRKIAELCHQHDALLHTDATQAVGRVPVEVDELDVDLLSFSAHKFYGPKGIGGLYVRNRNRRVRLLPQIIGGGQQSNQRSGTLNSAGLVGMQVALRESLENLTADQARVVKLRRKFWDYLSRNIEGILLNGPELLSEPGNRLAGNLNFSLYPLEGQSVMLAAPELAISSGSACTSANPHPSHVLRGIGLSEDEARSSLRVGIGRFNTEAEIDAAGEMLVAAVKRLQEFL